MGQLWLKIFEGKYFSRPRTNLACTRNKYAYQTEENHDKTGTWISILGGKNHIYIG
jgi:hypothetical protein